MNKDVIICAPMIQKIRDDGSVECTDAMYFSPESVVWMKNRMCDCGDYTIFKLKGCEPFMAEGSIEDYAEAMGCEIDNSFGWIWDDDDDD